MASVINLTGQTPVSVTLSANALAVAPLSNSVDVSQFDILDLQVGVSQFSGSTPTIYVLTSMQNDIDDVAGVALPSTLPSPYQWFSIGQFQPAIAPQFQRISIDKGFFRYIRWGMMSNAAGAGTFWIRGMGRRYGTP